jgi:hypothetical protein
MLGRARVAVNCVLSGLEEFSKERDRTSKV